VYWNKEPVVYVDAAGLPEPPKGMVYQVWALKLNPTPTSIGLLDKFDDNNQRIFAVNNTGDAEACNYIRTCRRKFEPYNGTIIYLRKV
jgi:hypothetical protein